MFSWFTIMSVLSLKDRTSLVRLKEKQLSVSRSASRWRSCRQTESHCVWAKTAWWGMFLSPETLAVRATIQLFVQWMARRRRGRAGGESGYTDGRGERLNGEHCCSVIVKDAATRWRWSFCCGVWFKDSIRTGMWRWRRGLPCQSCMCDIIGIPVVPNAHVVNQLDSPSPVSTLCRLNTCELELICHREHISLRHNVQTIFELFPCRAVMKHYLKG